MTTMCRDGILGPPKPSEWGRIDQLAYALFHRDHPIGTFKGQPPYLRQAYLTIKYADGYPERDAAGDWRLVPLEEMIAREA